MIEPGAAAPSPRDNGAGQLRRAELASGIGALVLGIGLGSLLSAYLASAAVAILAVGLVLHAWGMFDKHRLETKGGVATTRWAELLYWLCWVMLAVLAVYLLVRLSGR